MPLPAVAGLAGSIPLIARIGTALTAIGATTAPTIGGALAGAWAGIRPTIQKTLTAGLQTIQQLLSTIYYAILTVIDTIRETAMTYLHYLANLTRDLLKSLVTRPEYAIPAMIFIRELLTG